MKLMAVWVASAMLVGCGSQAVTTVATIELESTDPQELQATANVLTKRFEALQPTMSSSSTVVVRGERIEAEFRGESPSEDDIRYFGAARGNFKVHTPEQRFLSIVTDRDIEHVAAIEDEMGPGLSFKLTPAGGQRLLSHTSRNLGRPLAMTLDRDTFSNATINGVFGERFQTTGLEADAAKRISIILKYGRLPVDVRSVEVSHPGG